MNNLLLLSGRRWRTEFRSHLASVVIAAAVMTVWLLYWGYMEYMGASMSGRVLTPDFPADFAVTLPAGTYHWVSSSNAEHLQTYQVMEVETPIGMQSLAAVYSAGPNAPLPDPGPREVWLPEGLRSTGNIDVGSPFQIAFLEDLHYRVFEGTVAGFYRAFDFCPAIVVNGYWFGDHGTMQDAQEVILYNWSNNSNRWPGFLPEGATMQKASTAARLARKVVETTFSSGGQGTLLLFLFLILGVGTFSLLSYMDSRRELALLKSMGLRPREVSGLFLLEGLFTGLLAFGLTLAVMLAIDHMTTLPLTLSASLIGQAVILGAIAFAAATAVPYILAQKATVNELLFERPVPFLRRSVTQLRRNYPTLVPLLTAGYRLVKLPTEEGGFPGICFCQAGQTVKAGETLAWMASAWGLIEHQYLAPCDGEVTQADVTQGLLVIKPH